MSSIQMVRHVEWLDHFNIWTPVLSSFHTNQVFGIDMVTLSIFKPKCPIIEILHHPDGKCGQENIFVRAKRLSCIRMSRGFTFSSSLTTVSKNKTNRIICLTKDLFMSQTEIEIIFNFYVIRGLCYWSGDRVSKKDRKDKYLHEIS